MDRTSCLETAGFKDDYIYLSAILKWYHHMGQFVCQKNKIEINGEMDFLPDFELLSFWKHTATSEECLKRAGSCSKGTALLSMWHNRPNEREGRLGVKVEGAHLLVCTEKAQIPAASA